MSLPRTKSPDERIEPLGLPEGASEPHDSSDVTRVDPSYEEIARRAYELYLERGGEAGHDLEDWLRAEADLRRERA